MARIFRSGFSFMMVPRSGRPARKCAAPKIARHEQMRKLQAQKGQKRKHYAKADRYREHGEHERGHSESGHTGCAFGVDPHAAAFWQAGRYRGLRHRMRIQSAGPAGSVAPKYPFYNAPHAECIKLGALEFCAIRIHAISHLVIAGAS
jgi:hypothetical protein